MRDVTLDEDLLRFIVLAEEPANPVERSRVHRAAEYYAVDESGLVWVLGPRGMWLRVPWLKDRAALVREVHGEAGLCSGEQLYQLMKTKYFWAGMREACLRTAEECVPRQLDLARFKHPPYLVPTYKEVAPFMGWCLDCITHLEPAAPTGATAIVVAVDPFTKFVEAGAVPDLKAATITTWFHDQIVCRYGVPRWVRCDRGTEFRADFEAYCSSSGIIIRRTTADNPRANGQVERYNLMLRQGLRRLCVALPGAEWWQVLPDVVRALRILPNTITGISPFALVFKQHPRWNDRLELTVAEPVTREATEQEEEALFKAQSQFWDSVRALVVDRLRSNDLKMIRRYRR